MARIRTIKPSFFESEDVAVLPFRARLLWIGLWTHCDDQGRTKDHGKLIKARIWPLDQVTLRDIEEDLAILADAGRIVRYEADGQQYLAIVNWHDHQSINKPTPSKIPPPPNGTQPHSRSTPVVLPEDSLGERKGKEGKGREGTRAREDDPSPPNNASPEPPPPRCPDHIDNPDPPPCRRCGKAREARQAWDTAETERARRQRLLQASQTAKDRAETAALAIRGCRRCDHLGRLPNAKMCNHEPEAAPDAAAAAREVARAAARQPAPRRDAIAELDALAPVIPIRPPVTEDTPA